MGRLIAILLAFISTVHCRKIENYPYSIPIEYYPQDYEHVYRTRPHHEEYAYSHISRTDESHQQSSNAAQEIAPDDVPSNSSNSHTKSSREVKPTVLLTEEVEIFQFPKNAASSETSFNKLPNSDTNTLPPISNYVKQTIQPPLYQDDNDYISINIQPPKNFNQENPKYSDSHKNTNDKLPQSTSYKKLPKYTASPKYANTDFSPTNEKELESYLYPNNVAPLPNSYSGQPEYTNSQKLSNSKLSPSGDYKNSKNLAPPQKYNKEARYWGSMLDPKNTSRPPKMHQEHLKYPKDYKYPYYTPKPDQERPRYEQVYKYPSNKVYSSQSSYKKQSKYEESHSKNSARPTQKPNSRYPKNKKQQFQDSSDSSSEEEKPNNASTESASKSDSEIPKLPFGEMSLPFDVEVYETSRPPPPEYLAPQYSDNNFSGFWHAPAFYQSLKDFDEVENMVQLQIVSKGAKKVEKQYIIIAGVIDAMIKTMAQTPWRHYNREYKATIHKLLKGTGNSKLTEYANAEVTCVYEWINRSIDKLRAIMNNEWISHICRRSDVPCDTLVLAVVDASHDAGLRRQARLLLALGKAAQLFLDDYAGTLEQTSKRQSNLYSFMSKSKDYFKPLIKASSEARKLLPPSLYSCYDTSRPQKVYVK